MATKENTPASEQPAPVQMAVSADDLAVALGRAMIDATKKPIANVVPGADEAPKGGQIFVRTFALPTGETQTQLVNASGQHVDEHGKVIND